MNKILWNISIFENQNIKIYKVKLRESIKITELDSIKKRFLVFSHFCALNGIPSYFLDDPNSYSSNEYDIHPISIIFDIDERFPSMSVPVWCECKEDFLLNNLTSYTLDLFQKSLTLFYLYRFSDLNPLYFTTFLLFPNDVTSSSTFFLKHVPVVHQNKIGIRTIVQNDASIIVNPITVRTDDFILIPPFENPLLVGIKTDKYIIVNSENGKSFEIDLDSTVNICKITKTSKNSYVNKFVSQKAPFQIDLKAVQSLNMTEEEFNDFKISLGRNCKENNTKNLVEIERSPISLDSIIEEQIENIREREEVSRNIKNFVLLDEKVEGIFLYMCNFSLFDFYYGVFSTIIPNNMLPYIDSNEICYESIDIPELILFKNGSMTSVIGDCVFKNWVDELYSPYFGQKNARVLVCCDTHVDMNLMRIFISDLSDQYSLHFLGELKLVDIVRDTSFVNLNIIKANYIIFISDEGRNLSFNTPYICIKPCWLCRNCSLFKQGLAFIIYCHIFTDNRYKGDNSNRINALVMSGMYQPPFIIQTVNERLSLHICINFKKKVAFITDSSVRLLKSIELGKLSRYMSDISSSIFHDAIVESVTVFKKHITNDQYFDLLSNNCFRPDTPILTVHPLSSVQSNLRDHDGIIMRSEFTSGYSNNHTFKTPTASCIVVGCNLYSYNLSIYNNDELKLKNIARTFSHMSWASIKPGMEKRSTSYPPHIFQCIDFSKSFDELIHFNFLPSGFIDF